MLQIQCADKIGHVLSAPGNHFIGADVLVSPRRQPCLKEEDLGVMVGALGEDSIATGPRGHHVEWNPDTWIESSVHLSGGADLDSPGPT